MTWRKERIRTPLQPLFMDCGVPLSLTTDADGTSQQQAFRRWFTTAARPRGELVASEPSAQLGTALAFDFTALYTHDLAGRAQAFPKTGCWRDLSRARFGNLRAGSGRVRGD